MGGGELTHLFHPICHLAANSVEIFKFSLGLQSFDLFDDFPEALQRLRCLGIK